MKKIFSWILILALALSLCTLLALPSSAHDLPYVPEQYEYAKALFKYGMGVEHAVPFEKEPIFEDRWVYEYLDLTGEKPVFKPMGVFLEGPPPYFSHRIEDVYAVAPNSLEDGLDPYNYCIVGEQGARIHPGYGASPSVGFIVPVSGEINLDAALAGYGNYNTPKDKPISYGSVIEVWLNDTKIWPAEGAPEQRAWYIGDGGTCTIDIDGLKVKEGDRVRITATCAKREDGTPDKGSKGMDFVVMPVVTYVKTDDGTPVGNPNGNPPAVLEYVERTSDGGVLTWSAAENAVSYNVYAYTDDPASAVKLNSAPVTDLSFVATGLKSSTTYFLYVTTVVASGGESLPSEILPLKTRAGEASSDTSSEEPSTTDDSTTTSSDLLAPTTSDVPEPPAENSFPLWIVAVGAVVLLAVIVVVLLCRKKK